MFNEIRKTLELIDARDPGAYVVGGAVRDRLMGVTPADVDISIGGDAEETAAAVAREVGAALIVLDRERGHARLAIRGREIDAFVDVTSHGERLESDLRLRDFTINALAVPLDAWLKDEAIQGSVIDPTGGVRDLEHRTVRMTSAKALEDDPVRLARAVRFAGQLGFEIEPGTMAACSAMAENINRASPERVREEVYGMFSHRRSERCVRLLDSLGLLTCLIPELEEGKGVSQPPNHHYYDVYWHSVRTVAKVDPVLDSAAGESGDPRLGGVVPPRFQGLSEHFDRVVGDGHSHRTLTRLAALLHDVAKPRCKSFDDRGRMRFFGHAELGAEMAADILGRLRCSRRVISHVTTMIRHHLRPSQIAQPGAAPTDRALVRYFRDLGDAALDIVYLNMADYLAARGPMLSVAEWREYSAHCGVILTGGLEAPAPSRPFLLLDGTEVMAEFGLNPGPQVGRLLKALREAEAEGAVQTRQDALEFLRRLV